MALEDYLVSLVCFFIEGRKIPWSKASWMENSMSSHCGTSRKSAECYLFLLSCVLEWDGGMLEYPTSEKSGSHLRTGVCCCRSAVALRGVLAQGGPVLCSSDHQCIAASSRNILWEAGGVRAWQWEPAGLEISGVRTVRIHSSGRICVAWQGQWEWGCRNGIEGHRWWKASTSTLAPLLMLYRSLEAQGQSWRQDSGGNTWADQCQISALSEGN